MIWLRWQEEGMRHLHSDLLFFWILNDLATEFMKYYVRKSITLRTNFTIHLKSVCLVPILLYCSKQSVYNCNRVELSQPSEIWKGGVCSRNRWDSFGWDTDNERAPADVICVSVIPRVSNVHRKMFLKRFSHGKKKLAESSNTRISINGRPPSHFTCFCWKCSPATLKKSHHPASYPAWYPDMKWDN
jgi:hypothetical protein